MDVRKQISAIGIRCFSPTPFAYRMSSNPSRFTDEWDALKTQTKVEATRRAELEHLSKIDKSQIVYIVNPAGYVGVSVSVEVGYALAKGKEIYLQEQAEDFAIAGLASGVLSVPEFLQLLRAKYA